MHMSYDISQLYGKNEGSMRLVLGRAHFFISKATQNSED